MRYYLIPIKVTKIKITDNTDVGEDVEELKFSCISGGSIQWFNDFGDFF